MKLPGIFVPVTTPFDRDGEPYQAKVRHNVEKWNRTTLSGYVVLGSTGMTALPAAILTAVGRDADVFVAEAGVARRRRILVGPEQDGWRPVDGIKAGAQVVAEGRDLVADGTPLQPAKGK